MWCSTPQPEGWGIAGKRAPLMPLYHVWFATKRRKWLLQNLSFTTSGHKRIGWRNMHDNTAAQNDSPMPQPLGWGGAKPSLNLRRPSVS